MTHHQRLGDRTLLNAVRQRVLDEISRKEQAAAINNYINGVPSGAPVGTRGMAEQMSASPSPSQMTPEELDYIVDIQKTLGNKAGEWNKKVHRYTEKKGGKEPPKAPAGE